MKYSYIQTHNIVRHFILRIEVLCTSILSILYFSIQAEISVDRLFKIDSKAFDDYRVIICAVEAESHAVFGVRGSFPFLRTAHPP